MTNEEMCISIQNGDNTLKSQLWDNVSKIYYFLADKFFSNNAEKCTKCGLQRDDIHQLSYFAFEHSLKAFDISKGYAFTTYAKFSLLAVIKSYFCKDTLNRCKSLDEIIRDDEDGQTVADLVADNDSSAPFEKIEENSEKENISKAVRAAVDKLPDQERDVISKHYFDNRTFDSISEEMGVSCERVRQIKVKALRYLRHPKISKRLQDDLGYSSYRLYRHTHVDRIAIDRVMIEQVEQRRERYIQELLKQHTEKAKSQEAAQCC